MHFLTADDRSKLTRLALGMPKGDLSRRGILAAIGSKPSSRDLLRGLKDLAELDSNLTEMEDAFEANFRLASGVDPEVASQFEMLKKARTGLKTATAILQNAQTLVEAFPEDKTAARALKDAKVMVGRFGRHEAKAAKIIRTLSKKAAPPALAKAARQYGSALKKLLEDPSVLQIVPWQTTQINYNNRARKSVIYQVIFRIAGVEGLGLAKAEVVLYQNTGDMEGPQYRGYTHGDGGTRRTGPYKLSDALAIMMEQLKGYPGLKGEADANARREKAARDIKRALTRAAQQVSHRVEDPEVGRGTVSISFRTNINSSDYGEYDDTADIMADQQLRPAFVKALQGISEVKGQSMHEDEKGWWTYYVELK